MAELLITIAQRRVIAAIVELTKALGYAPTLRELATTLGISSTNGVAEHLRTMGRRGLVKWVPHSARTLRVTDAGRAWLDIGEEELERLVIMARRARAELRAEARRTGRRPGAPAGNRNASRTNRDALALRGVA